VEKDLMIASNEGVAKRFQENLDEKSLQLE
jgi:hypothetical protein